MINSKKHPVRSAFLIYYFSRLSDFQKHRIYIGELNVEHKDYNNYAKQCARNATEAQTLMVGFGFCKGDAQIRPRCHQ